MLRMVTVALLTSGFVVDSVRWGTVIDKSMLGFGELGTIVSKVVERSPHSGGLSQSIW